MPEWTYLRALIGSLCARWRDDEAGEIVETVLLIAAFAVLAIAVGGLIAKRVTARANEIPLQ